MADYRDSFRASIERADKLQQELVHARSGDQVLALRMENELLRLDREWRDKQEDLAFRNRRRQKISQAASAILFLVLAVTGITLLSMGTTLLGIVCFAASVTGWVLAGLQETRYIRLMQLYEEDRHRVDHMLEGVRVVLEDSTKLRVSDDPSPSEDLEEPPPEEARKSL
jgi:hypothetical protein